MSEIERTKALLNTDDAMVWAEEFCRIFAGKLINEVDEQTERNSVVGPGAMVAWFANAMQTAIDLYERKKLRDTELREARMVAATEHVPDSAREAFVEGVEDGREPI